ncbi:MAG: hypothetical protein ACI8QS_001836 [Planctomycetota bacterium]|jgi:hypothetical protein
MTSMPNNGALPKNSAQGGISGAHQVGKTGAAKQSETEKTGPAFRILLEQLQEKAAELQETSKDVGDPVELRGAIDTARATLEDALSLGDQVLEAFRSSRVFSATEGLDADASKADKNNQHTGGSRTMGNSKES